MKWGYYYMEKKTKNIERHQANYNLNDPYDAEISKHIKSHPNISKYLRRLVQNDYEAKRRGLLPSYEPVTEVDVQHIINIEDEIHEQKIYDGNNITVANKITKKINSLIGVS